LLAVLIAGTGLTASSQDQLDLVGVFEASRLGPLERTAHPATAQNPIPRRTFFVQPIYPDEAAAVQARAVVTLRVTVDDLGDVAEMRLADGPMLGTWQRSGQPEPAPMPAVFRAFVAAATAAVRQWKYEPPVEAPLMFEVAVSFSTDDAPNIAERHPAPVPSSPETQAPSDDFDRVPPAPWGEGVVRASYLRTLPTKVKHASPQFPAEALQPGVRATVVVETRIEADGRIVHARVIRSSPVFDQSVLDAVLQWEYTPTVINGVAIPVLLTVTVHFTGS
jgi:TonB family protein